MKFKNTHVFAGCLLCFVLVLLVRCFALVPTLTPLLPVKWLHIPKTGTSFINTIYRANCPRLPWNASTATTLTSLHRKYPPKQWCDPERRGIDRKRFDISPQDRPDAYVAMFRAPAQRMLSGYLYGFHSYRLGRSRAALVCDGPTERNIRALMGVRELHR